MKGNAISDLLDCSFWKKLSAREKETEAGKTASVTAQMKTRGSAMRARGR